MTVSIALSGSIKKPRAARLLKEALVASQAVNGQLIFGWPIGPNLDGQKGAFSCNTILISDQGQVTVIDLAEDADLGLLGNYQERQHQAYNIVRSCIISTPQLVDRRTTKVLPQTVTFAPEADLVKPDHPETPLVNRKDLVRKLAQLQADPPEDVEPATVLTALLSSI